MSAQLEATAPPVFNIYGHRYNPDLHARITALTKARIEGKELHQRRPATALRLVVNDGWTLVIKPSLHSSPTGWVIGDKIHAELHAALVSVSGFRKGIALTVDLKPDGLIAPRRRWKDPEKNQTVFEVLETGLTELTETPEEFLKRSRNHCVACGRGLTDPVSQARGIGPECLRFGGFLLRKAWGGSERDNGLPQP